MLTQGIMPIIIASGLCAVLSFFLPATKAWWHMLMPPLIAICSAFRLGGASPKSIADYLQQVCALLDRIW